MPPKTPSRQRQVSQETLPQSPSRKRPVLSVSEILNWAGAHHKRTGKWPTTTSGRVTGATSETWRGIESALSSGGRGLPGGSSLARLLAAHVGTRNLGDLPPLTIPDILSWMDAHFKRTGRWPLQEPGPIVDAPGETWASVNRSLVSGQRGLSGGGSLLQLLVSHRGVRHEAHLPALTVTQILTWADAHHRQTGQWPTRTSGPVSGVPEEIWKGVDSALRAGTRGLPGDSSLARLLAAQRGVRNLQALSPLYPERLLAWADAHHSRTGEWPGVASGPVVTAPGETWRAINKSLTVGSRGLPGGSSLARFLTDHRGVRNSQALPNFSLKIIRSWANAHRERTGQWPKDKSGPIVEAPAETWQAVDNALRKGRRGLPGGSSLSRFLSACRRSGLPATSRSPSPERIRAWATASGKLGPTRLNRQQILVWADAHHERTGRWPATESGSIAEAPSETWCAVNAALQNGGRGLPGGSSLARMLATHRGRRNHQALPKLRPKRILAWADAHHQRTGKWPLDRSGSIPESPGETWSAVSTALRTGRRGLPRGSSLARLLAANRGVRNPLAPPPLSREQIVRWAEAHYKRSGRWPTKRSGSIHDVVGESWAGVDYALVRGNRGLPGGNTLARLLSARHRELLPV